MAFQEISLDSLEFNPFHKISKEWMLVTAGDEKKSNTMTASWGGLGIMWGKNIATVYIRPQRYTKEFVDAGQRFTISFYSEEHRAALAYLGRVSGRDEDKIATVGFETQEFDGVPAFSQAKEVLVCKKLYAQPIDPACFEPDNDCCQRSYPGKDYHVLYIAEIEAVYQKE